MTSQFDPKLAVVRDGEEVEVGMVFKANRVGSVDTPNLFLAATNEIPDLPRGASDDALRGNMQTFVTDAETVVNALYASLPGGTLDQVLRLMLERKASQYVVRFF